MGELFAALTRAVEGAPAVALGASFLWGILSIILSPCHLASIPLIVGFINGQGQITTRRAFGISVLFSVGILITIGAIGKACSNPCLFFHQKSMIAINHGFYAVRCHADPIFSQLYLFENANNHA